MTTRAVPARKTSTREAGVGAAAPEASASGSVAGLGQRSAAPRLRDVAAAAGVHPSTASRALNDETAGMVQAETLERVRRTAREMGYRVNGMARALKTRRSMSIGMMVPDITNPFFPPAVRGAEEALANAGYSLLLSSSNNDNERAKDQLDAMIEARVDGLLLAMVRRRDPIIDRVVTSGIPTVLFNRTADGSGISSVVPDDAKGSRLAVNHVAELGHRTIGLVIGPLYTSNGDRRLRAFQSATRRLGLAAHVVEAKAFDEESGYSAAMKLFAEVPHVTAVVAGNDLLALGVIDAGRETGRDCPGDLSVVGFNDMPLAGRLQPPLTTVSVPEQELGQLAADCLLKAIADPGQPPVRILVPVQLIVRGSTAPVRA